MRVYRGDETTGERAAAVWDAAVASVRAPSVVALAGACQRAARRRAVEGVYPLALAHLDAAMSVVQALPYARDPEGSDALRDPAETIAEGGDCEDRAALLVALVLVGERLFALGLAACVVWVKQPRWPDDHVSAWVAARSGAVTGWRVVEQGTDPPRGLWWAETSVRAARGESPYAAVARLKGAAHEGISRH